ncbi:MAG: radical SAM protein [Nanoarchaeota archaeon]|nr:radical SAM protein [Nanoarchaeota archaeon]
MLKKTRSVCPECFEELDAVVYEKDNAVYMEKECAKHGKFKVMIEKDVKLYNKLMNKTPKNEQTEPKNFIIPFSRKCNLHCKICYLPYKSKEIPLQTFEKRIGDFDWNLLCISGGEPTLREDLPDLIKFINQRKKKHSLLTNGITLSDEKYVKTLKQAGLNTVHFSINALDKQLSDKIDGDDSLNPKLRGLENLRKNRIYITLSTMIIKGLNENQIRKVFEYYLEHPEFVSEWRIRSSVKVGRHGDIDALYLSELIKHLCTVTGADYNYILKKFDKQKNPGSTPCKISLSLVFERAHGKLRLLFVEVNENEMLPFFNSGYGKLAFGSKILNYQGIGGLLKYLKRKAINNTDVIILPVKIRSWPTKYSIDLEELSYCRTISIAEDEKEYPFCYALILNEKLNDARR